MKKLIVQLPALNEAASIGDVIKAVPCQIDGFDSVELIVVDDGSTDDTGKVAKDSGATVVQHVRTMGVGAAFRSGLRRAAELAADVVVTIDADGQFNPADIPALVKPILEGAADFVTASRFKDADYEPEMPPMKRWGNGVLAKWISRLTGQEFADVSCGFRAYSRDAYLRLNLTGNFTYTHEVFLTLAFSGMRIAEVPVRVRGEREHGESRVANNLCRYAWRTAGIILGAYRDYFPLRFFSMIAGVFFGFGLIALGFLGIHWLRFGAFTPYKAVGFAGGALCGSGLLIYLVGLVAQMLVRIRNGMEEVLYRIRKQDHQGD